jgi:hypothetical protein
LFSSDSASLATTCGAALDRINGLQEEIPGWSEKPYTEFSRQSGTRVKTEPQPADFANEITASVELD